MTTEIWRRDTMAERARDEREYKFSETRHFMSLGFSPDEVAHRLGTTRSALERLARRWDADDVLKFIRVPKAGKRSDTRPRRHCIECGRQRGGKNHGQRCWDCYRASVAA